MNIKKIKVSPPFIKLEQFLKFAGAVSTGGEGKNVILDGLVSVDGEVCLMRGKKLRGGEIVVLNTESYFYETSSGLLDDEVADASALVLLSSGLLDDEVADTSALVLLCEINNDS